MSAAPPFNARQQLTAAFLRYDYPELLDFIPIFDTDARLVRMCVQVNSTPENLRFRALLNRIYRHGLLHYPIVDDYISDLDRRWAVFEQIKYGMGWVDGDGNTKPPSVAVLAFVMVAPLENLEHEIGLLRRKNPSLHMFRAALEGPANSLRDRTHPLFCIPSLSPSSVQRLTSLVSSHLSLVLMSAHFPYTAEVPILHPLFDQPEVMGGAALHADALNRDGGVCVVTGQPEPLVINILCSSYSDRSATNLLNTLVNSFWPGPTQGRWLGLGLSANFDPGGRCLLTEISLNTVLCFSRGMADLWQAGAFGLKPVLKLSSAHRIVLEFRWLKPTAYQSSYSPVPFNCPKQQAVGRLCCNHHRQWGQARETELLPNRLITIVSGNPAKLPSMALLEFRWEISRLFAMVGKVGRPADESHVDV